MVRPKTLALGLISVIILWFAVVVFVDAKALSDLTFIKQNETDYEILLGNEKFILRYVPKESIEPHFGMAFNEFGSEYALVRNDLPPRVQRFVALHEIYHLHDFRNTIHRSTILQEIHANTAALLYEPIGFLQTVFLTITDPERLIYYLKYYLQSADTSIPPPTIR
ncbi:hypothetical protein A2797_02245 [candidate division WWE3 bacterium RIFCSPHIGHO2_01_FULL_48_15]|uniref:Uncharacterized protein n=1 Tax=candidate division WWE3 bacterium RIFCSPHIGHO2_01_FULL_48_15 TaxID=1802619 RepID=A0A1F4VFZ1_UNCKA|nr:MAG: hypothetical protein A2797_02245 [candidate division WWE3 bacterium RIFCSPHIGHO2_01_FULL_48_15]